LASCEQHACGGARSGIRHEWNIHAAVLSLSLALHAA
jgi:hypothetical protein